MKGLASCLAVLVLLGAGSALAQSWGEVIAGETKPGLLPAINNARKAAGLGPVSWDLALAQEATVYAQKCVAEAREGFTARLSGRNAEAKDTTQNWLFSVNERWTKDKALLNPSASKVGCAANSCKVNNQQAVFYSCRFGGSGGSAPKGGSAAPDTTQRPATGPSGLTAGQQAALDKHNAFRKAHGANALTWDPALAAAALAYVSTCPWANGRGVHDPRLQSLKQGENLYASWQAPDMPPPDSILGEAVEWFYSERPLYTGRSERWEDNSAAGHFTQVVWKATTSVGCAAVFCPNIPRNDGGRGMNYVACRYAPGGNMSGQFAANVQK